jgi:hypothetical protein
VQTTIVPVVIVVRVEDLRNITEERRAELIDYFDKNNLPRVVTETHYIISSDLQHDNAIIQKIFDDFICPYLKENAPDVTKMHVRSDGCKVRSTLGSSSRAATQHSQKLVCVPIITFLLSTFCVRTGPVQVRVQLRLGVAPVQGGLWLGRRLVILRVVPWQVLL